MGGYNIIQFNARRILGLLGLYHQSDASNVSIPRDLLDLVQFLAMISVFGSTTFRRVSDLHHSTIPAIESLTCNADFFFLSKP